MEHSNTSYFRKLVESARHHVSGLFGVFLLVCSISYIARIALAQTPAAFTASYYNNIHLQGTPVLQRAESVIDHSWGNSSPAPSIPQDYFSARWTGAFAFEDGMYEFTVTADDGVRLWIDGVLVVDQWKDQPPTTYTIQQALSAGDHAIRMEYYEKTVGATARLNWRLVNTPPPSVPEGNFLASYFNNTTLSGTPVLEREETAIAYSWDNGSPDPSIQTDNFSASWLGTVAFEQGDYQFTITADDGFRLWIDNMIIIGQWKDQPPTTYTALVTLEEGSHTIRMEYYERGGGATAHLNWQLLNTQPPPQTAGNFLAQYYNNTTVSGTPVLERTESAIKHTWGQGSPDAVVSTDNFSAQWAGTFTFEEGTHEFSVTADDGVRVWIDTTSIINQWKDQPPTTYTVQVPLTAGDHVIRMEYYEKGGGATAQLSWQKVATLQPITIAPGSFSIVVLPDTQKYSENYPQIFTDQTNWIRDQADDLNIAFVLHEGDIVENPDSQTQWQRARSSMTVLDGVLPYVMAVGNHDMPNASNRNTTNFNSYFPYSKYSILPGFDGVFEPGKMDNAYYLYSAGGIDFIVFSLEFGPRNAVLNWANTIVQSYPDRKIIMVTHDYVYDDNTLHGSSSSHVFGPDDPVYGLSDYNTGVQLWEKFVRKHPNMLFTFNGHVHIDDGAGLVVGTGDNGNRVYQMLANYQHYQNGGQGYLRFIEINYQQKFVKVITYSPTLNQFLTTSAQQFQFTNVTELDPVTALPPSSTKSLSRQITQGNDDAEEFPSGAMYLDSSDLEFVYDDHFKINQSVGLRFQSIDIPRGADIIRSYIQFTADETDSGATSVTIKGERNANAPVFTTDQFNITQRTKTSSGVPWNNIPSWNIVSESGDRQKTPDISSIIQEIIDLDAWNSSNSLILFLSGSGQRVAFSREGSSSKAPVLHIEWTD